MARDAEVRGALTAIHGGKKALSVETETLELKEDGRTESETMKALVDACLCLANANGGVVVLGVRNKESGTAAFRGTAVDPDDAKRRVYELTQPHLLVDTAAESHFGVRLLITYVSRSPEIHADMQGRAPRRVGSECLPLSPQDQAVLREERLGIDWSAQRSSRGVTELSPIAVDLVRRQVSTLSGHRRNLARATDGDLLRALGVVGAAGELLRAGEVLLCDARRGAQPWFVYQYYATQGGEALAVERLRGPALVAFRRLLELVQARRNLTPVNLPDGTQLQIEDFPNAAVREALANALIHRDYRVADPVVVEHSPVSLVVTSPGPLVSGVTPENILTHPSKPRNVKLTNAVRHLGLAEEIGRGVDRMFREMVRAGKEVPTIEALFDRVRVSFVGGAPNTQIARYVAQLSEAERDDTDTMLTILRLCRSATVSALDMGPIFQKTVEEAEEVLRRLASPDVGMLEPTRESARLRRPTYRLTSDALRQLGSAVRYRRRTVDEIDRKVIWHVREYGKITNRTVQNLLDVGMTRAKQIIQDLVAREVLVKTSEHERGPGVEYGRGPRFPASPRRVREPEAQQLELEVTATPRRRARRPSR